jgi:hypothetical protein
MSKYARPVLYTVEVVLPGRGTVVWMFSPGEAQAAGELYEAVSAQRPVIQAPGDPDKDGRYAIGINLVSWSTHPSMDLEGSGMILNQIGWESE